MHFHGLKFPSKKIQKPHRPLLWSSSWVSVLHVFGCPSAFSSLESHVPVWATNTWRTADEFPRRPHSPDKNHGFFCGRKIFGSFKMEGIGIGFS